MWAARTGGLYIDCGTLEKRESALAGIREPTPALTPTTHPSSEYEGFGFLFHLFLFNPESRETQWTFVSRNGNKDSEKVYVCDTVVSH